MNNDSDTSADLNINILDNHGDKIEVNETNNPVKKQDSSDTDYYLNLLANQSKLNDDSDNNSNASTSSLEDILDEDSEDSKKSKSSSSSSSRSDSSSE